MAVVGVRGEEAPVSDAVPASGSRISRRRFVTAALTGALVVAVPYSWVLFVLWNGGPSLLRNAYQPHYANNFYDLQARAIMAGHLYVPTGSLGGLESWIYKGHTYTYFGLFPSLLRVPIFLFTHALDGRLSACSLLLAWLVTGVFTSMLIWRVRVMLRGDAPLGRAEAVTFGVLVASQLGGSVLVYLAANPYVFSEDKAWSVALSIGAFLALLGVMERPSWSRVTVSGLLVLAATLTRVVEGYACILGAVLVALWFAFGRSEARNRRWTGPMFGIALLALAAGSIVSWAKSGVFFGQALNEYTAFHVLDESQINRGSYFGLVYFPTDLWAYLGPTGLRFSGLFPFVTLSAGPPTDLGGVLFDFRERTASVMTSMPLLFLLGCVGLFGVVRRHVDAATARLRLLLIAAGVGMGAVLFYGTLTERYLADFLPFFFMASGVGLVFLWARMARWSRRDRRLVSALIVALGAFGIVANVAIAITPNVDWSPGQSTRFLEMQQRIGHVSGVSLSGQTLHGNELPAWAPTDSVFIAGDCDALYVSTGERPLPQLYGQVTHGNWLVVEEGPGYAHTLAATFRSSDRSSRDGVLIATIGASSVLVHSSAGRAGKVSVWFTLRDPHFAASSTTMEVSRGSHHTISLLTDTYKHDLQLSMDGRTLLNGPMTAGGPATTHDVGNGAAESITIHGIAGAVAAMPLCKSLLAGH